MTTGRVRLQTGAVLGEMGLLINYRRTVNVLAITYVEMCILKRETFQQLIARYLTDRHTVLHRILQSSIERNDKPFPWQELCAMMGVDPDPLTPAETATALLEQIDDTTIDPSIQYGFQAHATTRMARQPKPVHENENTDKSVRSQVEEIQRGLLALAQMMNELAASVRGVDTKITQVSISQSASSPIDPLSPDASPKGSLRNLIVCKPQPRGSVRLLPLRPRVHVSASRGSLNHAELTQALAREALPLSTRLWAQNTPGSTTNAATMRSRPLHRRQSLSPYLP
ncbi:hypothetical protein Poli38472_006924 [Pythium oligandrum]|uniref:Cyclic nucleotide-binding domain-containing protein n=1 Tax=Pythium oligandrum TaxID=41045 RepID=A0A8K1C8R8_PYTOL|nr:hypothetical protein Poli38472_006924 [Pythium oligandrum]|eukprot:TMW58779.1 hypothetical protein Poli38472_006924 [Pythium oligandrum]